MSKQVVRSSGESLNNQEFFANFNWHNFNKGDVVWLEDYEGDDFDGIAGVFCYEDDDRVTIRLLLDVAAKALVRDDVVNISEIDNTYFKNLLKSI